MSFAWPALKRGDRGPEVGNLQRFLAAEGAADWQGVMLVPDEAFGQRTEFALKVWQRVEELPNSGIFGPIDRARARAKGFIPFIQAQHCNVLFPKARVRTRLIVIHTMENAEKPSAAEDVALWFAGRTSFAAPVASAHYCVDEDSVVQCVRDADVAWHAPGTNNDGIGIEHAGRAKQTPEEWNDAASRAILARSANLVARLCSQYDLPMVRVNAAGLKNNEAGICGHIDVTQAYPGPGRTHWDPGPGFPWNEFLDMINRAA